MGNHCIVNYFNINKSHTTFFQIKITNRKPDTRELSELKMQGVPNMLLQLSDLGTHSIYEIWKQSFIISHFRFNHVVLWSLHFKGKHFMSWADGFVNITYLSYLNLHHCLYSSDLKCTSIRIWIACFNYI